MTTQRNAVRKKKMIKKGRPTAKKTRPAAKKTEAGKRAAVNKKSGVKKSAPKKWSQRVNQTSDAMDLRKGIFEQNDSRKIAASLKRSAEKSNRRKARPFQSAMSMLNFYINRGGKNLSASRLKILEKAKDELRKVFGREAEDE